MPFKLLCTLIMALLFVSCSSLPPKSEAIYDTLMIDNSLRGAVGSCAALGDTEKRVIVAARNNWWRTNSSYVMAADWGLLKLNWDDAHKSAESQRVLLGLALLENIQSESAQKQSSLLKGKATTASCEKLAKSIDKGKFDVSKSKSTVKILDALNADRKNVEGVAATAQSINNRYRKYGRSLFVVEKALREAGCSSANISLLRNSWPLEVYDATCNETDYILVRCEWGRCELKR
jgi:hypothetical protein